MRQLTAKQKKMLVKAAEDFKKGEGVYPIRSEELPYDTLAEIDEVNPCEIFYQNVDRFLWDNYFRISDRI